MLTNLKRAPFPYFGGKSDAAPIVWESLGDVPHYVEPFAGSLAVLLQRPHTPNRPNHYETVNDLDGLLVNAWRSIKLSPKETAEAASWPVTEIDLKARSIALIRWRESKNVKRLAGDPDWHDPKMGGWWIWTSCIAINITRGLGCGGPWWVDQSGLFRRLKRKKEDKNKKGGVDGARPHLSGAMGVEGPGTWEAGVIGKGGKPHKMTEPELLRWFMFLSARMRHVRIVNANWERVCSTGALFTNSVRQGNGPVGVFLDPPYGDVGRHTLYGKTEDMTVAGKVREWCLEHGDDVKYRIVYAGFDVEGSDLENAGWQSVEWFSKGHMKGGMGNTRKDGERTNQQHRERLWLSPHCLKPKKKARKGFFDET